MAIKPDGKRCTILEQIIDDPASGLSFQFELTPGGETYMRIFGNLPFGNREIVFNADGKKTCAGTALTGLCKPTWLHELG